MDSPSQRPIFVGLHINLSLNNSIREGKRKGFVERNGAAQARLGKTTTIPDSFSTSEVRFNKHILFCLFFCLF